jgi:hypothetical protein
MEAKSGKVELFFSFMDVSFKIILLIIGVVFIIMYYSNSHGRYQYVNSEGNDFAILDTRDGIIHSHRNEVSFSINLTDGNFITRQLQRIGSLPTAPGDSGQVK